MTFLQYENILTFISVYFYLAIENKDYILFWILALFGFILFNTREANTELESKIRNLEYICDCCWGHIEYHQNNFLLLEKKYTELAESIEKLDKKHKKELNKISGKLGNTNKTISGIEFDVSNLQYDLEEHSIKINKIKLDVEELDEITENMDITIESIRKNKEKIEKPIHKLNKDVGYLNETVDRLVSTTDKQVEFIKTDVAVLLQLYDELKCKFVEESPYKLNSVCSSPFKKLELSDLAVSDADADEDADVDVDVNAAEDADMNIIENKNTLSLVNPHDYE